MKINNQLAYYMNEKWFRANETKFVGISLQKKEKMIRKSINLYLNSILPKIYQEVSKTLLINRAALVEYNMKEAEYQKKI